MKTPYFYIIKHKDTGRKYAGAKWAKDANPDNFMTETGYQTSSNSIKKIIEKEGHTAFQIEEIIKLEELQIPFGCQTIDEYESWFLKENNCTLSEDWYNLTLKPAYGTSDFYKIMKDRYGTKHALKNKEIIEKMKEKILSKTSGMYDNVSSMPSTKKTKIDNSIEKYGVDHPMKLQKIRDKTISGVRNKYGDEYSCSFEIPEVKAKSRTTKQQRYGDEYYNNNDKKIETYRKNWGSDHHMSSVSGKENFLAKLQEKYGSEYINTFQIPEFKEKAKKASLKTNIEKYGVDNVSKLHYFCNECSKGGVGLGNYKRYHKNHIDSYLIINGIFIYRNRDENN